MIVGAAPDAKKTPERLTTTSATGVGMVNEMSFVISCREINKTNAVIRKDDPLPNGFALCPSCRRIIITTNFIVVK